MEIFQPISSVDYAVRNGNPYHEYYIMNKFSQYTLTKFIHPLEGQVSYPRLKKERSSKARHFRRFNRKSISDSGFHFTPGCA